MLGNGVLKHFNFRCREVCRNEDEVRYALSGFAEQLEHLVTRDKPLSGLHDQRSDSMFEQQPKGLISIARRVGDLHRAKIAQFELNQVAKEDVAMEDDGL